MATRGPQAPGRLDILRRFLNTEDLDAHSDALTDPADLAGWLRDAGVLDTAAEATPDHLRQARDLRQALRAAMAANHDDRRIPARAAATLNRVAGAARLTVSFSPEPGWTVGPREAGVCGALGTLVAIVAEAMADGTWPRMKVCANDTCRWAFYDHSRARSGRWCSMQVCGNRAKQQTWRARRETGTGRR